jgi:hypothetical protein
VLRRLLCIPLALLACQPVGSGDGGLVIASDTAQVGPPPACNLAATTGDEAPTTGADAPTGGEATTGDAATTADAATTGGAASTAALDERATHLSLRSDPIAAPDPGTSYCAQFTSAATCDGAVRKDGEQVIGECRWWQVVPVVPGSCDATQLYNTCVHIPIDGGPCEAAGSCGQIGLGVYGRPGCDGTVEIIVVPPGQSFCATPTDWPLCWPHPDADVAPECTCICS